MKKINEKIKSLLKKELNQDILKISLTLFFYLFIIVIFRAGYEYLNVSEISRIQPESELKVYKYYITYKGEREQYNFNEPKTLYSLLEEIEGMELDVTNYYEGNLVIGIGGTKNFNILVDGTKIENFFFDVDSQKLDTGTKIEIFN